MRELFAAQHPPHLGDSSTVTPEKVGSINMHASDLEWEAGWDLTDLPGSPDLGNQTSLCGFCRLLGVLCAVVSESIPSSVADLFSYHWGGLL